VSPADFVRTVVGILGEAGVSYMLTGSIAAAYYSAPRATQDLDVVIEVGREEVRRLVLGLQAAGLYVDRQAADAALRSRGQFNAIDPESGWKVDLIVRKDRAFSETEFERRSEVELFGVGVSIASLEDVLLSKLEWSHLGDSELQRRDVLRLLERTGDELDRGYLERWVSELGLADDWQAILDRFRSA
jgi:hypothetical protein